MRVKSDEVLATPLYFREMAYSVYEYGSWRNPKVEFDVIAPIDNKSQWVFNKQIEDVGVMDIALILQDQFIMIPAPDNINSLAGKDIIQVEISPFGGIRVDARAGWINYRMSYANHHITEKAPGPDDLQIPFNYQPDFKRVAEQLDLYSKSPKEIINTVENYFKDNFYYSITQNQRFTKGQYLTKFLFDDQKGHCEYFATATALLLREAGIPTRYTIGFSIQEYSAWQRSYLVRARHAHSWVEYYHNGVWQKMDTTPSEWAPLEAEDRNLIEPLMDLFSWLRYTLTGGDIEDDSESNNRYLWLLLPLAAYLGWRFYHKQRVDKARLNETDDKMIYAQFGEDSPFYTLIAKLEKQIDTRYPGETLTAWIKRILPEYGKQDYIELINLHYAYRFNPASNKEQDKEKLVRKLNESGLL